MAHLEFYDGARLLLRQTLSRGRVVVGRSDRCDIALPSDQVSRVHCLLERRTEGWWLTDRSSHGTTVNGERIARTHLLAAGDRVVLGPYTFLFSLQDRQESAATTVAPTIPAFHEELVEVDTSGIISHVAGLRITQGPRSGELILLTRARTVVGGEGAHVVLDPELPTASVLIRVVRSRALVEPTEVPVLLAGARVRTLTPALPGEEVRLGSHAFVLELLTTRAETPQASGFGLMIGSTEVMRRTFGILRRVAAHDHPVLLTGESGTGKELAARGLHEAGERRDGPFVAVNCAGIPEALFESELFGHEKGSFSGATERQDGAFQRARGGTLFLDEVGELQPDAQAKLLRTLESGEVRRVGGARPEFPDVRVIAATNRDLRAMIRLGSFRSDLYFRLEVLTVKLPPLRERLDDLPSLATALLQRQHPGASLAPDALAALTTYRWPGNVRELRNVLTRAVVLSGPVIHAADLTFNPWSFDDLRPEEQITRAPDLVDPERERIVHALEATGGNRTQAARALGMPRSTLVYKLKKLGIS